MTFNIKNFFFDLIFPVSCISCGKNSEPLCLKCLNKISPCIDDVSKQTISLFSYHDPVMRKVLWALKYRNKKILAKPLGRALYDRLLEELEEQKTFKGFSEPILIPIPMSKKRLKERGYNQSELLCKELFLLGSDTFTLDTDVLHKQKETPRQATIKDRKKRLKNLHNSFSVVHSEKIMNKNILLVDDITTTGATLYEAIKVLKKAGAHKVIAITIAH